MIRSSDNFHELETYDDAIMMLNHEKHFRQVMAAFQSKLNCEEIISERE